MGTPHVDYRVGRQTVASMPITPARITDIRRRGHRVMVDVLPQERMPVVDLRIRRAAQRRGAKLFSIGAAKPPYRVPHIHIAAAPGQNRGRSSTGGRVQRRPRGAGRLGRGAGRGEKSRRRLGRRGRGGRRGAGGALAAWRGQGERDVKVLIPGEQTNSRGRGSDGRPAGHAAGFERVADDGVGLDTGRDAGGRQIRKDASPRISRWPTWPETFPDEALVREALANVPFLVVQDLFLTETASTRDVVLPAAEFPAKSGSYTNFEGRVQRVSRPWNRRASAAPTATFSGPSRRSWREAHQLRARVPLGDAAFLERIAKEGFIGGVPEDVRPFRPGAVHRSRRAGRPTARCRSCPWTGCTAAAARHASTAGSATSSPRPRRSSTPMTHRRWRWPTVTPSTSARAKTPSAAPVRVDGDVLRGTVQVPKGVVDAPVYRLRPAAAYPVVQVRKRVLEEVG